MDDSSQGTGFVPISPNPFVVGNPVRDQSMFFGREVEFELVKKRFKEAEARGGLIVFCGERRSGKTSILFQIQDGRLGPEFAPVLIDMQSMAVESEVDFLAKIAQEIVLRLETESMVPPNLHRAKEPAAAFQSFVESALREHPGKKLILLFDEYELFEEKIEGGVLTPGVLNLLSHLMEHQLVFVIFTGSLNLEDRKREYWNRFLGKAIHRRISYLDERDAVRLIKDPVNNRVQYDGKVVEHIYRLSWGQPFYTQVICQNLVDYLNEHRTSLATQEGLDHVVEGIVNNPSPQMVFFWDGLENDEKLVLALVAEALEDDRSGVSAKELVQAISRRKYPLDLDVARVSTALENLFKQEMLAKDKSDPPRYSYTMDLWRHWIRRMHSVWQVIRELGLSLPRKRAVKPARVAMLAGAVLVAAVGLLWYLWPETPPGVIAVEGTSTVKIQTDPPHAVIYIGEDSVGVGEYSGEVQAGILNLVVLAERYEPLSRQFMVEADTTYRSEYALQPLPGALHIDSDPKGAMITVDEEPQGAAPVTVLGLEAYQKYSVEASMEGFDKVGKLAEVSPGKTTSVFIPLSKMLGTVFVTTNPQGARVRVNDKPYAGPVTLTYGPHRFLAELDGYQPTDTVLEVASSNQELRLNLLPLPEGLLQLRGDEEANGWIDNRPVLIEQKTSSWITLQPNTYHIIDISFVRKTESYRDTIFVKPKKKYTYHFSREDPEERVTEEDWSGT